MNRVRKVKDYISNPAKIVGMLGSRGLISFLPDKQYLKILGHARLNQSFNIDNPTTYNEKIQWLKLYDRKEEYSNLVDKLKVRDFITETIGSEYLIPLIGVWDKFEDIDFEALPNQFVLKCTHDSGGLVICKDKNSFDIDEARKKINKCLKRNYYHLSREWPYKDIEAKIICEAYMVDESATELKDYKFFCFNGEPKLMFIASNRGIDTRFDFFDIDFNHLPLKQKYKNSDKKFSKLENFDEMVRLARILSKNIPHIRVDFYNINGKIYFGEMTFYHFSGFEKFEPDSYDKILGDYLTLPNKQ